MASNGYQQQAQPGAQRQPSIRGDSTSFHRPFRPAPALQNPELQVSHIDSSSNPQSPRGRGGPLQNRPTSNGRQDLPNTPPTPPVPNKSAARNSQVGAPQEYNPRFSFMETPIEPPAPTTNFARGPSDSAIFRSSTSLGTVPQAPTENVPPLPQFNPSPDTRESAERREYPESGDRPLPSTVQPSSPASAVPTETPKSYSDKQALPNEPAARSPEPSYPHQSQHQSQQNYIVSPIDDRSSHDQFHSQSQSLAANYPTSQSLHTPPSSQGSTPPQGASRLHTQPEAEPRPVDTAMHRQYDSKMPTPESEKESPPHSSTPGPQVPISSYKPTYNPDNPSGPNGLPPSTHQPGQIAHPNMKLGVDSWRNGLCDFGDVPTCCTGFWCPCILYGQTQYRLAQKSDRKDPTDMLGYKTMNGNCLLFTVGCGFQWAFAWFQHTRIHKTYDIPGSMTSDMLASFCCYSCMLMANEREVRDREEEARRNAGPIRASTMPYISPPGMSEL